MAAEPSRGAGFIAIVFESSRPFGTRNLHDATGSETPLQRERYPALGETGAGAAVDAVAEGDAAPIRGPKWRGLRRHPSRSDVETTVWHHENRRSTTDLGNDRTLQSSAAPRAAPAGSGGTWRGVSIWFNFIWTRVPQVFYWRPPGLIRKSRRRFGIEHRQKVSQTLRLVPQRHLLSQPRLSVGQGACSS